MNARTAARIAPLHESDPRSRDPVLEELVDFVGYRPNALLTMARKPGVVPALLKLLSVTLRGEARPSAFEVQGFATCPTSQTRVTQTCIERTQDEDWTLLEPGRVHEFRIATKPSRDPITANAAAATIRMIVRDGKEAHFQDISFARISLSP